jgi:hypothetical protein
MNTLPSHDAIWPTPATAPGAEDRAEPTQIVRAGLLGGLVGGVIIRIYEAIVWAGGAASHADGWHSARCDRPGLR